MTNRRTFLTQAGALSVSASLTLLPFGVCAG
jgi:hypothetical protein